MLRSFDADGEHFAFRVDSGGPDAAKAVVEIAHGPLGPTATIADAHLLFNADFKRAGSDLVLTGDDGKTAIVHHYFDSERPTLLSAEGASLSPAVVDALAGPLAPGQYAQATQAQINAEAVGRVATVSGNATILRNGVAVAVNVGDAVLKGDVLQTGTGTLGVTFNDSSTLNLSANTRLVVNEFVYDPNATNNSQLLSLVQGTLTVLSGQVAHSGTMNIDTPVATMGIRGTFAGVGQANDGSFQVWVQQSLRGIEAIDHQGNVLGTITQDGPMLIFHPTPLQVLVQELQRGPQQIALELSALQAAIATQQIGSRLIDLLNPNNPNPQSTDHAHTQIELLILPNLTQNNFNGGTGGESGGGGSDSIKVQLSVAQTVGAGTGETLIQNLVITLPSNLPPVVFSPPPEQVPPSNEGPVIFANQEVSVFDPDTDVLTVTLTATQGTVSLNPNSLGPSSPLTFTVGDGTDDQTMTFSGTQADINAALNGLTFTPAPNAGHHASLQIQASDGASDTTQTINFTTDAAPVLALNYIDIAQDNFDSASYAGNDGHVNWVGNWIELNDGSTNPSNQPGNLATTGEFTVATDPAVGSGFTLRLSDLDAESGVPDTVQRGVDLSHATPNSATFEFDYRRDIPNGETDDRFLVLISNDNGQTFTEIGQIGATGNGSFVDGGYQHFSYTIPAQYLTANTIFRFSVGDDVDDGDVVYVDNVKVTYNFPANYVEHGPGVPVADGAFNITDPDDTTLQSATVTLTNPHLNDLLSVNGALPSGITASYDATNHVLTLTGQASLAAYQTALHQVEFSNTGDNPDTADRDITITVNDGLLNSNTVHTTIHVAQVNDPPVVSSASVAVSEEGLSGGAPDSIGNPSDTTDSASAAGNLTASDAEGDSLSWTLGTPSQNLTSGGQPVVWSHPNATTLLGSVGAGSVLTVTIDNNGHYTVTLNRPIDHPDTASEDVKSIDVPVNVFDGSATTPATLTVNIEDDHPSADLVATTITPTDSKTNVILMLDLSGSMGNPSGLTGLTRLDVAKAAINELLEQYDNRGDVMVRLVTFASSAAAIGGVWMTVDQTKTALANLTPTDNTNYDAALLTAMSAFADSGKLSGTGTQNVSYFLSDGVPTVGSDWPQISGNQTTSGIQSNEQTVWETFLTTNNVISYAIGVGSGVTTGPLDPIAFDPAPGTQPADTPIVVTDLNQLSSTLVFSIPPVVGGFVAPVNGAVQGSFGGDGGHMQSITVDGVTYTFNPTANTITPSGGAPSFSYNGTTHTLTVDTDTSAPGGELAIVLTTGAFTFQPTQNFTSETVGYTLVDNDGDTAGNTLMFTASGGVDHAPIVRDDHVITNITGSGAVAVPSFALLYNDTDADGNPIAVTATSGSGVSSSGSPINTVTTTGTMFGYTGSTASPAASDTGIVTVDRSGGNSLTGTDFGEILIARNTGAGTTINANGGNDVLIGGDQNDTLNGGAGNDILFGGGGGDTMNGGTGNDTFVFTAAADSHSGAGNFDTITGFTHSEDLLDFSAISGLNDLQQSVTILPSAPGSPPASLAAHTIAIVTSGSNTVVYANSTGGTASPDMEIHLNNVTNVASNDFILHH